MNMDSIHPPRGCARLIWRLPIGLYRLGLGGLLGSHFLLLTHTGRKSGLPRYAAIEVMRRDKASDTYIVAAGFGEKSDWYLNLQKNPQAEIQCGFRRVKVTARRLPQEEAEREIRDYARRFPLALRALTRIVGVPFDGSDEAFRRLSQLAPVMAFAAESQ
jgi:deazaflavin-dependent oxidoreductase (nitroreductase family)